MRRLPLTIIALLSGLSPCAALAQEAEAENIQIGLSTDRVSITSGFSGTELTIFGALDNIDPLVSRRGRYDVIVVLEGPRQPVTVRKKTRVLGMWINTQSVEFSDVPTSYSVALTRPPQDITDPASYERLSLGPDNIHLTPIDTEESSPEKTKEFTAALRDRKGARGLYTMRVGGVQFLSRNLFRATLSLAPSVAVGTHRARAYLFREGVFLKQSSAQLSIRKAGMEQRLFEFAHVYSFYYGLVAVLVAMITGWLGRLIFKKD